MNRPHRLDHQLAELFGLYIRADGPERHRLGARIDAAYAEYLALRKEQHHEEQPADHVAPPRRA